MTFTPGALLVLYNPSATHVNNLLRLRHLCGNVVAVDNSPVPDLHQVAVFQSYGIDIVFNFNHGGVAGAYNRGIERLIKKGCDLLFLFDQDSEVPDDYFVQMEWACKSLDTGLFLIGPKIFDTNVKRYLPAHRAHKWSVKPLPIESYSHGLVPCASIISSGTVMSVDTYHALGPFAEDFFIDQVDTEYCLRALCVGVPIYINTALTLKHEVGKRMVRKFLFWKLIQWNMNPVRQYYSARNCIHLSRLYFLRFPLIIFVNIITACQIASVLLYEKDKRKKLLAISAGIVDGMCNRAGVSGSGMLRGPTMDFRNPIFKTNTEPGSLSSRLSEDKTRAEGNGGVVRI